MKSACLIIVMTNEWRSAPLPSPRPPSLTSTPDTPNPHSLGRHFTSLVNSQCLSGLNLAKSKEGISPGWESSASRLAGGEWGAHGKLPCLVLTSNAGLTGLLTAEPSPTRQPHLRLSEKLQPGPGLCPRGMLGLPAQSAEGALPYPLLGRDASKGSVVHMHYLQDLCPHVSNKRVPTIPMWHVNQLGLGEAEPEDTQLVSWGSVLTPGVQTPTPRCFLLLDAPGI